MLMSFLQILSLVLFFKVTILIFTTKRFVKDKLIESTLIKFRLHTFVPESWVFLPLNAEVFALNAIRCLECLAAFWRQTDGITLTTLLSPERQSLAGNICTASPITSTVNIFISSIIIQAVFCYAVDTKKSDNKCQTFWYFICSMWHFVFLEHKTCFCTNKPIRFSVCPKSYKKTWILF